MLEEKTFKQIMVKKLPDSDSNAENMLQPGFRRMDTFRSSSNPKKKQKINDDSSIASSTTLNMMNYTPAGVIKTEQ